MKQRIALILIGAIISCTYYLLHSSGYFQDTFPADELSEPDPPGFKSAETVNPGPDFNNIEPHNKNEIIVSSSSTESGQSKPASGRRLEIFGRVVDGHSQPIYNTLVAEERYSYNTRTDLQGKYKIVVDMTEQQYPVLRFLRSGFRDRRIKLKPDAFKDKSVLELDVVLVDDFDSISVEGWVGNDIGFALGGLKIQTTSKSSQGLDIVFQTVFSDENGFFSLEGIKSGDLYKLTVFSPPEYLFYVDEKFTVSQNTPQLNIVLEALKFVDIDGMIVNRNAVPIPNFEIYINNISTGTHVRKIVSDSSGFFSLPNFPVGKVSLTTQGPEYFKINGLALEPDEYQNLRLLVDKGDHYLSGWVSDQNGVPLKSARVKLNAKIESGKIEYLSYRIRLTDMNGNFNFSNLDSGEHLLTVEAYGYKDQDIVHNFQSQTDNLHITLTP